MDLSVDIAVHINVDIPVDIVVDLPTAIPVDIVMAAMRPEADPSPAPVLIVRAALEADSAVPSVVVGCPAID